MKKFLIALLTSSMVLGLAACGGGANETTTAAPAETTAKAEETTEAEAEETTTEAEAEETSADAGTDAEAVTLTVWTPADDVAEAQGDWLHTEFDKFAEANPQWDLTLEWGEGGEGEARDLVLQDVEAAADVYMYANDQINDLVSGNALARLSPDNEQFVRDTNSEDVVTSVTVNDAIYGFPFTTNTWFMYYDTSVFSEEDIQNLDTMLEKGTVSFPLKNSWYLASFYLANGGTMFGADGTDDAAGIDFGGEAGVETTEYLVNLVNNDNFVVDSDGLGLTGLADGSVNAIFSGSWDYSAVQEALGDNFGAAQLPTANIGGEPKQLVSFNGTKVLGVNPNAENQQAAMALAKWLSDADAQASHYELRNIVPSNTELLNDPAFEGNAMVTAQNDTAANTSVLQPFVPSMGAYWTPAENFGTAIANGDITLDNAAERTEEFNTQLNTSVVG